MKRIVYTIIVLLLFQNLPKAQINQPNHRIDSLKRILQQTEQDSIKAKLLYSIGSIYSNFNSDSADLYLNDALQLIRKEGKIGDETKIVLQIGRQYLGKGDFPRALDYLNRGLKLAQDHDLKEQLLAAYWYLGHLYDALKEYKYLLKMRKAYYMLSMQNGERNNQPAILRLSRAYCLNGMQDSAKYFLKMVTDSLNYLPSSKVDQFASDLGDVYNLIGQPDSALLYLKRGVNANVAKGELRIAGLFTIKMGRIYAEKGMIDSAIFYSNLTIDLGDSIGYVAQRMEAAKLLGQIWEESDPARSLKYYKMALETTESIYGVQSMQAIKTIELQQKESEQKIVQARQKSRQNMLAASLAGLLLFAAMLFYIIYKQRKVNAVLSQQKAEIQQTLEKLKATQAQLIQSEKMASLGELTAGIAHEIQNPLNFVNNFSEVNSELIEDIRAELTHVKTDSSPSQQRLEEAAAILNDLESNQQKITHHGKRADAIVKGMLQHSRSSSGQKEPTDLNALCDEYLRLAYHGLKAKDKSFESSFHFEPDETLLMGNVVPQDIGRVLLNLINNAFYAVAEKSKLAGHDYQPAVSVSTKRKENAIEIAVADNGNGIPDALKEKIFQPFFTTKPTGQGTGLGLSLAYDIVKAHGGEIKVSSQEGGGSVFTLNIPAK